MNGKGTKREQGGPFDAKGKRGRGGKTRRPPSFTCRGQHAILLNVNLLGGEVRNCGESLSGVVVSDGNHLHLRFNKRVGAKPGLVANQNVGATASDKHPQSMHVFELAE